MQQKARILTPLFFRLFLISTAICTGMNMLNGVMPLYITETLGGTAGLAGLMTTVYTISACLSRPINGALTDRVGRRKIMTAGSLLFAAGCVLCGLIPSILLLVVCRIMMGVGYSAASTANNTASTDIIPTERLSEGIGYFGMSQSLASALGPAIASVMVVWLGNQNALFSVAAAGVAALLLSQTIRYESGSQTTAQKRKGNGFIEKTAILPSLFQGLSLFLITCLMCFMTLYIVSLGFPSTVAGSFFLVASLLIVVIRMVCSHWMQRFPVTVFLIPGYLFLILACLLLPHANSVAAILGIGILYGGAHGTIWMALGSEAVRLAPPEKRGLANATFYLAFDAAIGLGAAFWGTMIDHVGYTNCFRLVALCALILAAVCIPAFRRRIKQ